MHAIGVSTLAGGHKTLVPAIVAALRAQGVDDIIVFVGGVIPQQDYAALYAAGVAGIYGPGTPIPDSAADVLAKIRAARRIAAAARPDGAARPYRGTRDARPGARGRSRWPPACAPATGARWRRRSR